MTVIRRSNSERPFQNYLQTSDSHAVVHLLTESDGQKWWFSAQAGPSETIIYNILNAATGVWLGNTSFSPSASIAGASEKILWHIKEARIYGAVMLMAADSKERHAQDLRPNDTILQTLSSLCSVFQNVADLLTTNLQVQLWNTLENSESQQWKVISATPGISAEPVAIEGVTVPGGNDRICNLGMKLWIC